MDWMRELVQGALPNGLRRISNVWSGFIEASTETRIIKNQSVSKGRYDNQSVSKGRYVIRNFMKAQRLAK
jgi:hypothetical protein